MGWQSTDTTQAFATAIVTTFFAPTRGLTICNAGHPRPLLYRARHRTWECLGDQGIAGQTQPCNIPLGIFEISDYKQFEIELEHALQRARAVRVARITALAERTFGDPAAAFRWLRKPKQRFEGRTPLDLLATDASARLVEEMIHQIDDGMAA